MSADSNETRDLGGDWYPDYHGRDAGRPGATMILERAGACALVALLALLLASPAVCDSPGSPPRPLCTLPPALLPPPSPDVVQITESEYPVSAWLAGLEGQVDFDVLVDSLGKVTSIKLTDGEPPFSDPALRALRQWKFASPSWSPIPIATVRQYYFDFSPDRVVYSEEEGRIISYAPQPLVSYPFNCEPRISPPSSYVHPYTDFIAVRISQSGFVEDTRFLGSAPPDSENVRRAARKWIFRPFVAPDGPHAGHIIPVWTAIRVARSCWGGREVLEQPDAEMRAIVERAGGAWAANLAPSLRSGETISGLNDLNLPRPSRPWLIRQLETSDYMSYRDLPADSVRALLRSIVDDQRIYAGKGPIHLGKLPDPEYALTLWCGGQTLDLAISPNVDFIELNIQRRVVFVSYRPAREKIRALINLLFGGEDSVGE